MPLGGRRPCTRSIHWPERSASAERFFSAVSQRVSKRPIWLGDAAAFDAAFLNQPHLRSTARGEDGSYNQTQSSGLSHRWRSRRGWGWLGRRGRKASSPPRTARGSGAGRDQSMLAGPWLAWCPEVDLGQVRLLAQHVKPVSVRDGDNEVDAHRRSAASIPRASTGARASARRASRRRRLTAAAQPVAQGHTLIGLCDDATLFGEGRDAVDQIFDASRSI
jgi:hypothetical protein